jgi:hypothetical protein
MKAYRRSIGRTPLILNLGTRWSGQLHAPVAFPLPKKNFKWREKEATQIILKQNNEKPSIKETSDTVQAQSDFTVKSKYSGR